MAGRTETLLPTEAPVSPSATRSPPGRKTSPPPPPVKEQVIQHLIGDIGIDLQTIRKITGSSSAKKGKKHANHDHNRVASLIAPSVMLARPGVGVDPQELSKALKKIKSKVAHGDSKQAKYVQVKAELAHRRNLVLLMVRTFLLASSYGCRSRWAPKARPSVTLF